MFFLTGFIVTKIKTLVFFLKNDGIILQVFITIDFYILLCMVVTMYY